MLPFIGKFPLVAHKADFDMDVLRAVLAYYQIPVPKLHYFCSLKIAQKVWPELSSHALTALGKTFSITYNAHNALEDALTCGTIVCLAARAWACAGVRALLRRADDGAGVNLQNCTSRYL
jgi:DNA polymerase-3 subunit epsilon